jgi:hypothetical protein
VAKLDQRIGEAAIALAVVILADSPGERLQCGAQHGSPFRVEHPTQPQHSARASAQGQRPRLDCLSLFGGIGFRVGSVAHVMAEVAEPADAELARLLQKRCFIEGLAGL